MNDSLKTKLETVETYLTDLQDIQPANYDAFEQDKMLRRYAERVLHMTIDTCIQTGIEVLMEEGLRTPENYHDVFTVLGEHRLLSPLLVNSMTLMVELRNLIVYEPDVLDHMMIYSVLKRRLDDLQEFVRAMQAYGNSEPYTPSPEFETVPED